MLQATAVDDLETRSACAPVPVLAHGEPDYLHRLPGAPVGMAKGRESRADWRRGPGDLIRHLQGRCLRGQMTLEELNDAASGVLG